MQLGLIENVILSWIQQYVATTAETVHTYGAVINSNLCACFWAFSLS